WQSDRNARKADENAGLEKTARKKADESAEANKSLALKEAKARLEADKRREEAENLAEANKQLATKESRARQEADARRRQAEKLALHVGFEQFYHRSRDEQGLAMVGAAGLLAEASRLHDRALLDSIRLHLSS